MILVDGVFYEGTAAPFDMSDRGLTLADGLFETMPVFGGTVWRLADHLDRLVAGLAVLGFQVPRARLEADVAIMAARAPAEGGVLRLTVTRGSGARGLAPPASASPTVIIVCSPFNEALLFEGTSLGSVSIRRNETSPASRLKSLAYLDNVLALAEAQRGGARDALILNTAGSVACTSVANVFRVTGSRIETPPASDGVLCGITRARVLALARELGLEPAERSLTPVDLISANEVFLTNSLRLVQPVESVDSHPVQSGDVARQVFERLLGDVRHACGRAPG